MHYEVVKKVFKQHSSLAVVLPLYLRRILKINKGDYVVFRVTDDQGTQVLFSKLDLGVLDHGRDNGDSG